MSTSGAPAGRRVGGARRRRSAPLTCTASTAANDTRVSPTGGAPRRSSARATAKPRPRSRSPAELSTPVGATPAPAAARCARSPDHPEPDRADPEKRGEDRERPADRTAPARPATPVNPRHNTSKRHSAPRRSRRPAHRSPARTWRSAPRRRPARTGVPGHRLHAGPDAATPPAAAAPPAGAGNRGTPHTTSSRRRLRRVDRQPCHRRPPQPGAPAVSRSGEPRSCVGGVGRHLEQADHHREHQRRRGQQQTDPGQPLALAHQPARSGTLRRRVRLPPGLSAPGPTPRGRDHPAQPSGPVTTAGQPSHQTASALGRGPAPGRPDAGPPHRASWLQPVRTEVEVVQRHRRPPAGPNP